MVDRVKLSPFELSKRTTENKSTNKPSNKMLIVRITFPDVPSSKVAAAAAAATAELS